MPPKKSSPKSGTGLCREIAQGVYCLEVGRGFSRSNVYFVRSGSSWFLVDAASANCELIIKEAAERLFGPGARPLSILLTHDHPDHAGAALQLAAIWGCSVYLHPDELPLAVNGNLSTITQYANPLDRWIILPLLRAMPRRRVETIISRSSLKGVCRTFSPGTGVPGFPDWQCIFAPGHTPGHVAFFRNSDRVLITGDALVTVNLNSIWGILFWGLRLNRPLISGPPWYSTWNWKLAKQSVTTLAGLEPRVLAPGHGLPQTGVQIARRLNALAERFAGLASAGRLES